MRKTFAMAIGLLVVGMASVDHARAQDFGRCSGGTAERLSFIEQRLEERQPYARYWWMGWTSFYSLGMVIQSVQAPFEGDDSRQADLVISAVKASFGVTRLLLWPPNSRLGADPMYIVEPVDESACRERLRLGEELMRKNARESESRWDWKRHVANVAINVGGALIVAEEYGDPWRGWRSAGIGIAVGEVFTFSHPWKADDDLAEYDAKFGTSADLAPRKISFDVAPTLGGLQFGMRF
jgi:hypothetical protein